jgi:nucleotide-binding universal stress UspA family protein
VFREQSVLFPTDFSPYARFAMEYAIAMARQFGGMLHVAHVIDSSMFTEGQTRFAGFGSGKDEMEMVFESVQEHAITRLSHVVQISRDQGVEARMHILRGVPWERTVALAAELGVGLVVIPTHGRSGFDRMVYGSVCERVVRQSPAPVLCIKHPEHEFVAEPALEVNLQQVVFPTDFSDFSLQVLPYAVSLCRMFDARLTLVHVTETPLFLPEMVPQSSFELEQEQRVQAEQQLEKMARSATGVSVDIDVRTGQPHRQIAEVVIERGADLVVVPTHGHSGIRHVLFGSVAEKVVRSAPCPVMTVRPGMVPASVLEGVTFRAAQNAT